jgi:hypothetical protein
MLNATRLDRRLGELERHPIALADGQILGAILLSRRKVGADSALAGSAGPSDLH